jgi:hypothetical protein
MNDKYLRPFVARRRTLATVAFFSQQILPATTNVKLVQPDKAAQFEQQPPTDDATVYVTSPPK